MMDRAAEQPAGNEAEPQLGEAEKEVKATEAADGADAAAPAQPVAAAHTGKTIVVEFNGHQFPGLDDGSGGFNELNGRIENAVTKMAPNADARRKAVAIKEGQVAFTGKINADGSLADVERFINGPPGKKDNNFTSLADQIKGLPNGATVRVVIVGYSHGAENAIAAVRAITTYLKNHDLKPEIHLVLIDAIQPGDPDEKKGNQRLGAVPYTTLDDGNGDVRGLLASFHNYYQTLGEEEGQDKLGMVGAAIPGEGNVNRKINELLDLDEQDTNLRDPRKADGTPHMAAENVLAREKADPNNPQAVPLAQLIAGWEVQGF